MGILIIKHPSRPILTCRVCAQALTKGFYVRSYVCEPTPTRLPPLQPSTDANQTKQIVISHQLRTPGTAFVMFYTTLSMRRLVPTSADPQKEAVPRAPSNPSSNNPLDANNLNSL